MKGVISRVRNESDEEKEQLNGGGPKKRVENKRKYVKRRILFVTLLDEKDRQYE